MLYRLPSLLHEMGQDILPHPDAGSRAPVARIKQLTTAGERTSFITEHTLIFVLEGQKHLRIESVTYTAEPGQLMVIKRGIYVMSELMQPGSNYEALLVFFTDAFVQQFVHQHQLMPLQPVSAPAYIRIPTNNLLDDYKTQFLGYFGKQVDGLDTLLHLKQQELMLLLLASPYKSQVLSFLQSIAWGHPQDIGYIVKKHLFQSLSLEELAKLSNRSLASFKRDFQQLFGSAPKKWINDQRLEHARSILQHSNKQVSEIALECGFENTPHFIRIFKQKFGVTPNAARAKNAIV
jgi:AraC-like DNA-binding protein